MNKVVQDLQLVPVKYDVGYENQAKCSGIKSIELINKLLSANRISSKLEEFRVKA
jgi:hypothetical protein